MPKDEFDFEDPLELHGVELPTDTDTVESMGECFAEEFFRLGHHPVRILALFRNPAYTGAHRVWQYRGEDFVRGLIEDTAARWGRRVDWNAAPTEVHPLLFRRPTPPPLTPTQSGATDPLGDPAPEIT